MRRIELSNGVRYGTNNSEGGVFRQNNQSGNWHQIEGNSQSPLFKTAKGFFSYLRTHYPNNPELHGVKLQNQFGW